MDKWSYSYPGMEILFSNIEQSIPKSLDRILKLKRNVQHKMLYENNKGNYNIVGVDFSKNGVPPNAALVGYFRHVGYEEIGGINRGT